MLLASVAAADPCGELDKLLGLGSGSYDKNFICHALFWKSQRGSGEICFHNAFSKDCPTTFPLTVDEAIAEIARLRSGSTAAPKSTTTSTPAATTTLAPVTTTDEPVPTTARESLWTKPSGPVQLETVLYDSDSLDFVVFGDVGYANELLRTAVRTARDKLSQTKLTAAMGLGDNFYPYGIISDVTDKQFKNVFDDILAANFPNIPFHMVLGNHDHLGNTDAQLEYSSIHPQWVMPFNYYRRTFRSESDPTLTTCVWFLDTDKLSAKYSHDADQLFWLDQTLYDPHCFWKIVVGHHPFYDAGEYHDDKRMIERVLPILQKHGVHLYLSGHEHQTQILIDDYMTFIISGCTAEKRSGRMQPEDHPHLAWADSQKQAFVHLAVSRDGIVYTVHEARGRIDAEPLMRGRIQAVETTTTTTETTETTTEATETTTETTETTITEITQTTTTTTETTEKTTETTSTTEATTETTSTTEATNTEITSTTEATTESTSTSTEHSTESTAEITTETTTTTEAVSGSTEELDTTTTEIPSREDDEEDEESEMSETSEVTENAADSETTAGPVLVV